MKYLYFIFIFEFLLSQYPMEYRFNNSDLYRYDAMSDSGFASNGIMDIRTLDDEILFLGTGAGLSFVDLSSTSSMQYGNFILSEMPKGGNPALAVDHGLVTFSGVVDTLVPTGLESKGTGLAYSINDGEDWNYLSQPVDPVPNLEDNGFQTISWGNQQISALSVTTNINNVSYDIAVGNQYIYTANWAAGIRRYNYLPSSGQTKNWEIIPLPRDDDLDLYCGDINVNEYEINPKDPGDGGNHNHKGFGVYIIEDTLWVGTAAGINKGIILDDNCINWIRHYQSGLDNISGNWVIGFTYQELNGYNRIWAITWATQYPETNALSYSNNGGASWNIVNPLGNESGKVYNLNVYGNRVWASTERGLYYSEDGEHWEKYSQPIDISTGEEILSEAVFSTYFSQSLGTLFVGTGDGLAIINESMSNITRFWKPPDPFSAYPNPFLINDHNQFSNDGYMRFIFLNPNNLHGIIDIYDFAMDRVIQLDDSHLIGDESEIIWNGRNEYGDKISNGVYFCRLSLNGQRYWTKLAVIN